MRRAGLGSNLAILVVLLILFTATILIMATPQPVDSAPAQLSLTGTIREAGGGPINGARVEVALQDKRGRFQTLADYEAADGSWTFGGRVGTHRLTFSADGARTQTLERTFSARGAYAIDVDLECVGFISGVVRDGATGAPVEDAEVGFYRRLADGSWPSTPTAETFAPDGGFTSPELVTGTYAVTAEATDYPKAFLGGDVPTPVVVGRGQEVPPLQFSIAPAGEVAPAVGTIAGRIYGPDGVNGLFGFVYFFKQSADLTWPSAYATSTPTASDGTYTSPPLELGTYKVRLFTVHTGSQWWRYESTYGTGWPITLDAAGQAVTGVDARFPVPAP